MAEEQTGFVTGRGSLLNCQYCSPTAPTKDKVIVMRDGLMRSFWGCCWPCYKEHRLGRTVDEARAALEQAHLEGPL